MENKTIRQAALNWFSSKFQIENGEIYASKVARIYLSAEAVNMFTEVRGKGKVDFKTFRII